MENQTTKRIILSCGVILVLTCICLGLLLITGVGVTLLWPLQPVQEEGFSVPEGETQTPDRGGLPQPSSELPEALAQTLFEIETQVIALRGLDVENPVDRTLISTQELEKIVTEDFLAEYSDENARQDVVVLSLLGLLPEGYDLKSLYQDLYSEQIAGFYDDEAQEIYVVQAEKFGGNEKLTYAHEFTHVLQDQVYDLSDGLGLNDEACEQDSEKCAAVQALIEGDATKTEILWFQSHATLRDYRDVQKFYSGFSSPVLDEAPLYIAADLGFPYEKGLAFVEHLYEQEGFEAVTEAYQNLPVSTEQILHPEKYPQDTPRTVTLPNLTSFLDEEWSLVEQNVMGEWYTFLILNKGYEESIRLDEETAFEAAEGWGGDSYAFYQNTTSGDGLFVMDAVWDSSADAEEFSDAFEAYAGQRWGEQDEDLAGNAIWENAQSTALLMQEGNRTVWIITTDREMLPSVLEQLK